MGIILLTIHLENGGVMELMKLMGIAMVQMSSTLGVKWGLAINGLSRLDPLKLQSLLPFMSMTEVHRVQSYQVQL